LKRFIIYVCLFLSGSLAHAASFDCAKASTTIEKTICADDQISDLDGQLSVIYKNALSATVDIAKLKEEQKDWIIRVRNKCEGAACLRAAYQARVDVLQSHSEERKSNVTPVGETKAASNGGNAELSAPEDITPANTVPKAIDIPKVVGPAPTSEPETSKPVQAAHQSLEERPTSITSDIFSALAGVVAIAMFAGLVRPKWILRKAENPKRWQIVAILFPIGITLGIVTSWTMTNERKTYEQKLQVQKKEEERQKREMAEQERAQAARSAEGAKLYSYYKSMSGNEDQPGYNEQQFHGGELISVCNVNGKPRGYYGWIEFSTLFMDGNRIKNAPVVHMYVFFVLGDKPGDRKSGMWRGEQYKQQLIDTMHETCD